MTSLSRDLDPAALLAEHDFVRRLARSLIYDPERADDVVQQTWLAALRNPPRQPGSTRAFLARVVRGVAANLVRSETRRRRHEGNLPAPDDEPAVEQMLARESLRQEVVGELASLDEPYRATLVARFWEDLQPTEIARRSGIPAGTVRARLKRGLDMLRGRMDARHGGDRAAWCTPLLAIAGEAAPGAVAAGGTKVGWAVAAAAALIGAVGWLAWRGDDDGPRAVDRTPAPSLTVATESVPTASTAAGTVGSESTQGRREPARATPSPETAVETTVLPTDTAGLFGRLVLPDGSPAAGRSVQLVGVDAERLFRLGSRGGPDRGITVLSASTVSDADGRFQFAGVRPNALLALRAGAGGDHSTLLPLPHTPQPDQSTDVGDVVLPPRATLAGTVVDEDGEPVAGAKVWASDIPSLVTLAVNLERFDPNAGAIVALPKRRPGEDAETFRARVRSFLRGDMLMETVDLDGDMQAHVVDTPDWAAKLWRAAPIAHAETGADGRFELHDVPDGTSMLVVRKDGIGSSVRPAVRAAAGARHDVGEIELDAGDPLRVQVVDRDGVGVADAEVRIATVPLAGFRGVVFCEPRTRTDGQGSARMDAVPGGRVLVAARRRGDEPWHVIGPVPSVAGEARVELPPVAPLHVRVRQPAGTGDPEFTLTFGPRMGEMGHLGMTAAVDVAARLRRPDDGTGAQTAAWAIADLPPGSYLLGVRADGCLPQLRLLELPHEGEVQVDMAPAAPPLELLVRADGRPVCDAAVEIEAEDGATGDERTIRNRVLPTYYGLPTHESLVWCAGRTDADGRLRIAGLAPGRVQLRVDHPAHGARTVAVELPCGMVQVELEGMAVLEGRLVRGGAPLAPPEGRTFRLELEPERRDDGSTPAEVTVLAAADGSFRATGLEPGVWHAKVLRTGRDDELSIERLVQVMGERQFVFSFPDVGSERTIVLTAGATRRVDLDVDDIEAGADETGRVVGRVRIDGQAVPGLTVGVTYFGVFDGVTIRSPGARDLRAETDADGRFAIPGLREGRRQLAVTRTPGEDVLALVEVLVQAGADTEVAVEVRTTSVRGRVRRPTNRPDAACSVNGSGPGGAWFTAPVAADGSFEAHGISEGTWTLSVNGDAIGSDDDPAVELTAGATPREVNLVATPRYCIEVATEAMVAGEHGTVAVMLEGERVNWMHTVPHGQVIHFGGLPPGRYLVRPWQPEGDDDSGTGREVVLGADAVVRIALP